MSSRYTVDLDALLSFADRLARFNTRAEEIAEAVDRCVAELHGSWLGAAATADLGHHAAWLTADGKMRDGLEELRKNAELAHRNYSDVAATNRAMWP